jgi:cyclopropane fatty-acyl-phospholipid synthase-like methyltransferase
LQKINSRPKPFEFYTAEELWTDEHTSGQMLKFHLNESIDLSSRNSKFIEKSVRWIADKFSVNESTIIADFGCGPGLYANRLAEHGANVTGIDFSRRSIEYAEKAAAQKGLKVNYVHKNYLDYETELRFDLIIMIFCDYCALSPEQRKIMLSKYYSFLKPGGHLLLDVHSLNIFNKKEESASYELNQLDGFWSPDNYYCFLNSFKYNAEKVSLDKYTIIEESGRRIVYNWLQYFSKESLTHEIEESGLKISEYYSDVSGKEYDPGSDDFCIVAEK